MIVKFEKEFREAHPETIGEKDSEFDLSNYADWLETLVEEKFTSTNRPSAPCLDCVNCECVCCVTCCSSNGYAGFIKGTAHVG